MPNIIDRMRLEPAVCWQQLGDTDSGHPRYGPAIALATAADGTNYNVRWVDVQELFIDIDGTQRLSSGMCYVPLLPNGEEIKEGDLMWRGALATLPLGQLAAPRSIPLAYEVRRKSRLPSRRYNKILRRVWF